MKTEDTKRYNSENNMLWSSQFNVIFKMEIVINPCIHTCDIKIRNSFVKV